MSSANCSLRRAWSMTTRSETRQPSATSSCASPAALRATGPYAADRSAGRSTPVGHTTRRSATLQNPSAQDTPSCQARDHITTAIRPSSRPRRGSAGFASTGLCRSGGAYSRRRIRRRRGVPGGVGCSAPRARSRLGGGVWCGGCARGAAGTVRMGCIR